MKLPSAHSVFSKIGLTLFTIVIVAFFVLTAFFARYLIESGQMAAVITSALVDLTNQDRKQEDLGTLTINPVLVEAAQAKANDMAEKGYFAHTSPEGIDPWYWIKEAGYNFSYAGENLAVNFSDSEDVVAAWMDSPGHRANILSGKFTEIGIATAVGEYNGHKTTFVVQMFGTPKVASAPAPIKTVTAPTTPEEIAVVTTEDAVEVLGTETSQPEPVVPAVSEEAPRYTNDIERAIASPHALLRILYLVCAGIILGALILATRLEWEKHHIRHVVAASALLVLMAGLFTVADVMIFTDPVIAKEVASL